MKAIGIVGSPRKGGNTELYTSHVLEAVKEEGLETELIRLAGLDIRPCDACMICRKEETCPIKDDLLPLYDRMKEADAIMLASPVYFGAASGLMKVFTERVGQIGYVPRAFAGKVGGPLIVGRRAGHTFAFSQLLLWYHSLGFFMPGSSYWNVGFGREKGEVKGDEEGMITAWNFGKNIALLVKKLRA
jgi:multimeric flavodoxin WrbA